ncbi:DNA-binding domain-containing protein [Methylocystis bryophila]|uniref:Putative DNA-binding domain-containing protein n=1 Tax=Methylocystis bryophila TaxID=655015 RepID=A0A1W6MYK8_9HYPH|nr:DNA-binding domain-containing protein [Methylocystis bryophila]ARN82672.1 hypothetical protein B1812_17995 [Methylocystis bryophila]BDV38891.1 hypothetical protein DSM21852_21440 [Methylocystis bryophila]
MKLAELQSAFQSAVLSGAAKDSKMLACLTKPAARDRAAGFGVYVKGYRLRVAEYLEEDFPALKSLLGDKRFDALVSDYLAASPSRTRNARYFSTRLPDFMQESDKWRGEAQALGVALLERALTDAFDAPDGDACALQTLAAHAPQDWPRLVFAFHPSLRVLRLPAGVVGLYEALSSEGKTPLPEAQDGEEAAAVWRSGFDPAYRALETDEFLALNEALAGKSFGAICQLVAFQQDEASAPERLAQFLINWFSDGLVVAIGESDDAERRAAP